MQSIHIKPYQQSCHNSFNSMLKQRLVSFRFFLIANICLCLKTEQNNSLSILFAFNTTSGKTRQSIFAKRREQSNNSITLVQPMKRISLHRFLSINKCWGNKEKSHALQWRWARNLASNVRCKENMCCVLLLRALKQHAIANSEMFQIQCKFTFSQLGTHFFDYPDTACIHAVIKKRSKM